MGCKPSERKSARQPNPQVKSVFISLCISFHPCLDLKDPKKAYIIPPEKRQFLWFSKDRKAETRYSSMSGRTPNPVPIPGCKIRAFISAARCSVYNYTPNLLTALQIMIRGGLFHGTLVWETERYTMLARLGYKWNITQPCSSSAYTFPHFVPLLID